MPRSLTSAGLAVFATIWLGASLCAGAQTRTRGLAPDESALRYYASQGQTDRVAAEAARLTQKFPDWRMPAGLGDLKPGRPGEGPLWAMFAEGKDDAIRAAIKAREAAEPGWHASPDLVAKLGQRASRAAILRYGHESAWRDVVREVKQSGTAWAVDDAETLWIIAEAYARENDTSEAYTIYHTLLANHGDAGERVATIQHAIALIPMNLAEKLVASGHASSDGRSEFDGIATDLTRARLSAVLHDEAANPVSAAALLSFQDYVRGKNDPAQEGLVAWYAFKQGDYRQALDWFKLAIADGGDAMIAHGLAFSLRKLGMRREAEDVAYAWREPLVNNSILYIDLLGEDLVRERPVLIEPARLARYAQEVTGTGSGEGAQALAWYAYNTCQFPLALEWFARAVSWMPKEATVYGYALTLRRLKRAKEFREIVNRYDGLFPRVVGLAFETGAAGPPSPCDAPVAFSNGLRAQPAGYAQIPSPQAVSFALEDGSRGPAKPADFPFAVAPENPLRFSSLHTVVSPLAVASPAPLAPRVARRVPGVGLMPYERAGYALMPGWDGTKEASSPTAMERPPAAGTFAARALQTNAGAK